MFAVAIVVGYLIGAVPVAVLVGKRLGVDPRVSGDQNAGWWNMRQLVGKRAAAAVLVGDVAKGAFAAGLGLAITDTWWVAYAAAGAAMIGHAFPVFAGFRGGKSILTWAGAMAAINPLATISALGIGFLTGGPQRKLGLGLRTAFIAYPFVQAVFTPLTHVAATGILMVFIGLLFLRSRIHDHATSSPDEGSPA